MNQLDVTGLKPPGRDAGHRIDLDAIEARLREHAAVEDAVLVGHETTAGEQRLVAYVVPARREALERQAAVSPVEERERAKDTAEQVREWAAVFDAMYRQAAVPLTSNPQLNAAGWNSSYTNAPLPGVEMAEWVQQTVHRVSQMRPRHVLEVGCGTGLVLLPLAPTCTRYVGTDISGAGLAYIAGQIAGRREYAGVQLRQASALEAAAAAEAPFDVIVMNSVVQYFPGRDYLLAVVAALSEVVREGGWIVIGDVRTAGLVEAFHASVEEQRQPAWPTAEAMRRAVAHRRNRDEELVLDPRFFRALAGQGRIGHAEVWLRRGTYHNEMTRFRYDVLLQAGSTAAVAPVEQWLEWESSATLERVAAALRASRTTIGLRGVPNARVRRAVDLWAAVEAHAPFTPLRDVQRLVDREGVDAGVDPEALWRLGEAAGYDVRVTWQGSGSTGRCDALFVPRDVEASAGVRPVAWPAPDAPLLPAAAYAGGRGGRRAGERVTAMLRAYLEQTLPDFMMPADIVLLDALPLTPEGTLDRRRLPVPSGHRPSAEDVFAAPETATQQLLARLWCQVLGLRRVGLHDNFFELGGDSIRILKAIAAASRAGLELLPQQVFTHPTIAQLASAVAWSASGDPAAGHVRLGPDPADPACEASGFDRTVPGFDDVEDVHALAGPAADMFAQSTPGRRDLNFVHTSRSMTGELDAERLESAFQRLAARHAVLRTSLVRDRFGNPARCVHRTARVPFTFEDWRARSPNEQDQAMLDFRRHDIARGIDPAAPSPLRVFVARLRRDLHSMVLSFNSACLDGWTLHLLFEELASIYKGRPILADYPSYRDYLQWVGRQDSAHSREYWVGELCGADMPTPLGMRPAVGRQGDGSVSLERVALPGDVSMKARALARARRFTENLIFQSAWLVVTGAVSERSDVVAGIVVTGRTARFPDIHRVCGSTTNWLPLRISIDDHESFGQFLWRVQQKNVALMAHEHVPLSRIRAWCGLEQQTRLFDSIFFFQNLSGIVADTPIPAFYAKTACPLRVDVYPGSARVGTQLFASYDGTYFSRGRIQRLLGQYASVVQTIAEDPDVRLGELRSAAMGHTG